jgi:hypothetical protein
VRSESPVVSRNEKVSRAAITNELSKINEKIGHLEKENDRLKADAGVTKLELGKLKHQQEKDIGEVKRWIEELTAKVVVDNESGKSDSESGSDVEKEQELEEETARKMEMSLAHAGSNTFKVCYL